MPADPTALRFTVVVPTLGQDHRLNTLLDALASQTLDRSRWDLVVSFDGAEPSTGIARRLDAMSATTVSNRERRGPGAARNAGAARAMGDYLAFTEDDCLPSSDWLALAAQRLERDPGTDVLEGATVLPDGSPARRREPGELTFLPTNLIVLRSFFERIGGYCEQFFDPERGVYFREDSDFGFTALEQGARAAFDPAIRVEHPREHPGWLDPIRWAQRYEMDPLLARRHPAAFRERIEIARLGPFRMRRPFVRACTGFIIAAVIALTLALQGEPGLAVWFAALAGALLLVVWSKWRFDPRRIPLVPAVPFVLVAALLRGRRRASLAQRTRTP
ncbi:MAG TPA: glycosyltransferase family A protein [Candidatus Eisenbacteria bacterium]|nr:glycosyltransferase family A protein [Candidatus Eisenbacteria bacterium]